MYTDLEKVNKVVKSTEEPNPEVDNIENSISWKVVKTRFNFSAPVIPT